MNFINCNKEYITARYEYLRDHIRGIPRLSIFDISNWEEPWGFGEMNKEGVNKIYKEAFKAIFDDSTDSISENARDDFVIITLKTDTEIGIVWISEDEELFRENMEDLFNAEVINKKSLTNIPSSPTPKKPDNIVINKMHLFKNV